MLYVKLFFQYCIVLSPNLCGKVRDYQTQSNQNRMKNAEVEKIRHWSALVGQLGRSKNSRGHLKLILCCSLPHIIPHIKFHLNRMKNTEVPIFEFWDP